MPIFDFKCKQCGTVQEKLIIGSTKLPAICECGGEMERKFPTAPASFRLKGTGWYETDFKNKNNKRKH